MRRMSSLNVSQRLCNYQISGFVLFRKCCTLHCKLLTIFPSPAGMSLTKLSLAGKNYSWPWKVGQGKFGQWHPGWGREYRYTFFTVYLLPTSYSHRFFANYNPVRTCPQILAHKFAMTGGGPPALQKTLLIYYWRQNISYCNTAPPTEQNEFTCYINSTCPDIPLITYCITVL